MPMTGAHAATTGYYKADYHVGVTETQRTIHMIAGREFPPCPHCHRPVNWTLIQGG
jgi:hypothetical protein